MTNHQDRLNRGDNIMERLSRRGVTAVVALMAATAAFSAGDWAKVKGSKRGGISGLALVKDGKLSRTLLMVHDNKRPDDTRCALIKATPGKASYEPLAWPDATPRPVDIEALCSAAFLSGGGYLAMTSNGDISQIRLMPSRKGVEVVRQFAVPGARDDENYEGLDVQKLGDALLVVWGHRGKSASPGVVYWGVMDDEGSEIAQEGWASLKVPWPEGGKVRHISDVALEPDGTLFISSASDPGDDGPFDSAVYKAGRFVVADGAIRFQEDLEEVHRAEGQKIEALVRIAGGFAVGTDNENSGSTFRLIKH